jgi:hypothetical protein
MSINNEKIFQYIINPHIKQIYVNPHVKQFWYEFLAIG